MTQQFALMTANGQGNACGYERYCAGWLIPTIVEIPQETAIILKDTHVDNEAVLIPIRRDGSNNIVEHFFVENYRTLYDYPSANPFLERSLFGRSFVNGLLTYHIENQHLDLALNAYPDIESAEGNWQWEVVQGQGTPSDRTDDIIDHVTPTYDFGDDDRDAHTITVGSLTYPDYYSLRALDNVPCGVGNPCPTGCSPTQCNHGWRFSKSSSLGDPEDFWREGQAEVFSSYSNPSTYLASGTSSNTGYEVTSYNSTTKEYSINVQITSNGVLGLKPSRPQNLRLSIVSEGGDNHVGLTWGQMREPDVLNGGNIFVERRRRIGSQPWTAWNQIAQLSGGSISYTDNQITSAGQGPDSLQYRIRARDNTQKYSVYSVAASMLFNHNQQKVSTLTEGLPEEFALLQNYPNPFNPLTTVKYQLPVGVHVTIKIFDTLGREVMTVVDEAKEPGYYNITLDVSHLSSGVYMYSLTAGSFSSVKKMVIVK